MGGAARKIHALFKGLPMPELAEIAQRLDCLIREKKIMRMEDWLEIVHFAPERFYKDPLKADPELVREADATRELAGVPMHVHVCWDDSGHAPDSYHFKGKALDFHYASSDPESARWFNRISPVDELAALLAMGWGGIGYYPFWRLRKNGPFVPGWHVDTRPRTPYKRRALWVRDQNGKYHYGHQVLVRSVLGALTEREDKGFYKGV